VSELTLAVIKGAWKRKRRHWARQELRALCGVGPLDLYKPSWPTYLQVLPVCRNCVREARAAL